MNREMKTTSDEIVVSVFTISIKLDEDITEEIYDDEEELLLKIQKFIRLLLDSIVTSLISSDISTFNRKIEEYSTTIKFQYYFNKLEYIIYQNLDMKKREINISVLEKNLNKDDTVSISITRKMINGVIIKSLCKNSNFNLKEMACDYNKDLLI